MKLASLNRVWIIDDDEQFSRHLTAHLTKTLEVSSVEVFETAECCLEKYQHTSGKNLPDVFFVDVQLPGMSGIDLVRRFYEIGSRIPSIVMSSQDRAKVIRDVGQTRATSFLVKPAKLDDPYWEEVLEANLNFSLSRTSDWEEFEKFEVSTRLKQFYGAINHDYRQPIVSASLAAQIADEKLDKVRFRGKKAIQQEISSLRASLVSAKQIIEDISLITEDGEVLVKPKKTLFYDLERHLKKLWSDKFDTFSVNRDRRLKSVCVDKAKIYRAISNVISNSAKYSSGLKECDVSIEANQHDPFWSVTIVDNGFGIPPADVPLVGTVGFRSENVTSLGIEGSGKGIVLAKRYCEIHLCQKTGQSGSFDIKNRIDGETGTSVTMVFPKKTEV